MKKPPSSSTLSGLLRKLALYGLLGLFGLYVAGVAGGYSWLRFVRKNDQIRLIDVALFRVNDIRRAIAVQHFANAQVEWDAKNYQAAYLLFSTAVHQDPDNLSGRLSAVRFLRSVGAGGMALIMLEEGLARSPENRVLIEPTFDFLLSAGRDRHALDLLRQYYGTSFSGPNAGLLRRYELKATLAAAGVAAAKQLLDKNSELLKDQLAAPVVARVLWESQERLRAIRLLQDYLRDQPAAVYADFALLAGWQEAGGQAAESVQTARRACERFPHDLPPRVLLIEMIAAETPVGNAASGAIAAYLRDYSDRPEALAELAVLAGRKGWVDLARTLYEVAANRQPDVSRLALSYSDALARGSHFKEVRQILLQVEAQAAEGDAPFMVQLRQRQVIAAAALGDVDNVHEYARRLAAILNRDPDGLEVCRRLFSRLGIVDAVSELSSRSLIAGTPPRK